MHELVYVEEGREQFPHMCQSAGLSFISTRFVFHQFQELNFNPLVFYLQFLQSVFVFCFISSIISSKKTNQSKKQAKQTSRITL